MSSVVFLSVIAFLTIYISVLLTKNNELQTYKKKLEKLDTEREDLLLRRIEQVATQMADVSRRLLVSQSDLDSEMDSFLKQITLQYEQFDQLARADVVSARREELLRCKELKVALERLMGVAMTSRQPPSPNDVVALENLTKRIEELEKGLATK